MVSQPNLVFVSDTCQILFHDEVVALIAKISPHQTTYFATFQLIEGKIPSPLISAFISRCLEHADHSDVDNFSDFNEVTAGGWRIEVANGRRYQLVEAPLFSRNHELSFSLSGHSAYETGEAVDGVVISHHPFGAFVRIDALTDALLKIVDVAEPGQRLSEPDFPAAGSIVRVVVMLADIVDGISRVAVSTRPSLLVAAR